jgi:hypothetical protein
VDGEQGWAGVQEYYWRGVGEIPGPKSFQRGQLPGGVLA